MAYNKRKKLQDNIEAIKVAFDAEQKGGISDTEREVLKKYSGFGGLKFILNPASSEADKQSWKQADQTYFDLTRELYNVIHEHAQDQREEQELVNSIKRSVTTAFYTPNQVIESIAKAIKSAGVDLRSMIDPSAGIGKFGDAFKAEFPDIKVTDFEKDLLTGKILKALNPMDDVTIDGFETVSADQHGTFDIAVSNIPFGDISVFDTEYSSSSNEVRRSATKAIHNYFFLKALDMVHEGGFVVFITSRGFMDSPSNNALREELIKNSRLVGAFRLPEGMFLDEAGTEVGSDLVVLQKYTGYDASLDPDSQAFCVVENGFKAMSGEDWTDISLNAHWWKSMMAPDSESIIATKWEKGTDPYGKPTLVFAHDGGTEGIAQQLKEYLTRDLYQDYVDYYRVHVPNVAQAHVVVPVSSQRLTQPSSKTPSQDAPVQLDFFAMWDVQDSQQSIAIQPSLEPRPYDSELKAYYRDGMAIEDKATGQLGIISTSDSYPRHIIFSPLNLDKNQEGRMRQYILVRDAYQELYATEAESRQVQPWLRKELNRYYDEYIIRYGYLNERKNARILLMDGMGRDVLSLENAQDKKFVKADIFERPVSFVAYEITHVDTPEDALFASLNRYGVVNLEYMSGLTGHSEEDLISQLKGRIYFNPIGHPAFGYSHAESNKLPLAYDTAEHFLSGNVYEKLDRLQAFYEDMRETMPDSSLVERVKTSVEALEQSLPQQIPFDDIGLQFGERWIPTSYYEEYISKLFDSEMEIRYTEHIDEYSLKPSNRYSLKIREEFCVRGEYKNYDGMALLAHAFHNTTPDIQKCIGYDDDGKDLKGPDMEKIQLASTKIDEIRDGFAEYLTNLPRDKRDELQMMYNRKFNCFVKAKYDGSHQTFPGIDMKTLGSSRFNVKDIYKSQKDCVWMLLQNGGGICDHEVGTGKTLIMCMAAHEMHRLGIANKPMIIALKANVAEIAATYQAAFPDDKILYASEKDFSPQNRKNFFLRIKNNDYACVIMSHDQFGKIPQSMDIQHQILSDELRDLDEALDVLRNQGDNISGRMLTGLEKRKENLSVMLQKINHDMEQRKDDFVDFGLMGIDHIFVDESHQFKNLTFTTRHQRVSGLGNPAGSQKALNLLYAIRTIQNRTGKDLGATFLSGTTISNSLTELYLLFKYLRPQAMAAQGIHSFDAWAAVYAKKTSDYEFSVTNSVVQKERFRYFVKVPELATFYNEITDYRTGEDVGLDRPNMNVILHNIKPTADQRDFNERLMQFAQTGDGELIFRGPLSDREQKGKMLIATDASRKASLDMRLVDRELFDDDPDNKASHCAYLVSEYYHKYHDQKGTQFIFSDLSTYKPGEWNIFQEIKDKLVRDYGIPAEEIRFIQEAKNEKQRKELIKAMNDGTIRVLFGSTSTLGTGVNAQKRAVAVHHIDIPWRPSDLEQRDGRARRTGNEIAKLYANNNVDIIIYAVERTLDSYKFNLLQNKQLFISQLKTNSLGTRVIDEGAMDEENGMNFAEYVAILSGNDDLLQKAKLEKRIMAMESERKTYMQARRETERRLEENLGKVENNLDIIRNMTEDYEKFQKVAVKGNDDITLPGLKMHDVDEYTSEGSYNIEGMGQVLQDAGRTVGNKNRQVGTVYGFPLIVNSIYMWDDKMKKEVYTGNTFYVKGHYLYEHNNGHLAMSKDNRLGAVRYGVQALEKIPAIIQQYRNRNEALQRDIAEYQRIAGKAWGKEDELKGLKKEMETLDKKIQEGLDNATQSMQKPQDELYKISKEGRYHQVKFARATFSLVSMAEMREYADSGNWRERGYVQCGHWEGKHIVSAPEVEAEFAVRRKAEEFIQQVINTHESRLKNMEWLVAKAKEDSKGDFVHQENEVIFSARQLLMEREIDWQKPIDDILENTDDISEIKSSLLVYSLGQYGMGERGEDLRTLAHQVKEQGTNEIISQAVNQLSGIFKNLPHAERERMVLIPMPGAGGVSTYTDDIVHELSEKLGIDSNSGLFCSPHPSIYQLKKEQGNDHLPPIAFSYNGSLPEGSIVVLVDNVLDTGHTISQAAQVNYGKNVEVRAAVLAYTDNHLQHHPDIVTKDIATLRQERKDYKGHSEGNTMRIVAHIQESQQQEKGFDTDNMLRDALIEVLHAMDIEVITDKLEGQKVLEQTGGAVRFMRISDSQLFTSNARRAVEHISQERATPMQWLKMIEKNGGIKVDEDHWMGLSDWLRNSLEQMLTKGQVLEYIAENQIIVNETQYNAPGNKYDSLKLDQINEEFNTLMDEAEGATGSIGIDDHAHWAFNELVNRYGEEFRLCTDYAKDDSGWHLKPFEYYAGEGPTNRAATYYGLGKTIDSTRLSYITEGLDNNKEIALTVPAIDSWGAGDTLHFGDAGDGRAVAWVRFGETMNGNERMLVIDEIQSKRHQEGRVHGYLTASIQEDLNRMDRRILEAINRRDDYHEELRGKYGQIRPKEFTIPQIRQLNDALEKMMSQEDYEKYKFLDNRVKDLQALRDIYRADRRIDSLAVPDAPFKKNWHELAVKRMLRYAAENGYDRVVWTTGLQQAERYSLGNVVQDIHVSPNVSASPMEEVGFDVDIATSASGHASYISLYVTKDGLVSSNDYPIFHNKHISEIVGKTLGEKILSVTESGTILSGDDLRFGIEGMQTFYDHIVPNFINKYGKRWGIHAEDINIPHLGTKGMTMHSVAINTQMKKDVLQSQPMFFKTDHGQAYGFVYDNKIYIDPAIATAETPIHEYTHLWAEVLRQHNPTEWSNIVQMMKDTPEIWDRVLSQYPNLLTDDEIAEEALAQYSGQRGTQRLMESVRGEENATGIFEKISAALGKFWDAVADFLHIHYTSKEEVADRVMYDLLNGINPLKYQFKEQSAQYIQGLEHYDREEIKQIVVDYVNDKLGEAYPDEDVYIKQVTIIGSRSRGEAHDGSDLDILLEYGGEGVKEDALFNVLNETRLEINGISVDINPINEYYSLNTDQWLERDLRWREQDLDMQNHDQALVKKHEELKKSQQEIKSEKQEDTSAVVYHSALLVAALEKGCTDDGIWLNKCGSLSTENVQQLQNTKPFEALMMALQADTQGKCPSKEAINEDVLYRQVIDFKDLHPDAMILMRNGDFYEMYGDDAERGTRILGIVQTSRSLQGKDIAFAGFPHRALDTYLPKLIRAGLRVAICDALVDNAQQKRMADGIYAEANKLVKILREQDDRVQINPLLETEYDTESKGLCINNSRKAAYGKEVETATMRVNNIYRAVIAYTGAEERLHRIAPSGMLPDDGWKYDRLVQELAAGVIMVRQGLPARLPNECRVLVPYWQRELNDHPLLIESLERDVNNAIQVLGKLMRREDIDYAIMRGEKTCPLRPQDFTIATELTTIPRIEEKTVILVKDEKQKTVAVILPEGISAGSDEVQFGMDKSQISDALRTQGYESVTFYSAGGSSGLNQPNSYFVGKIAVVARLEQQRLAVTEELDLSQEIAHTDDPNLEKVTMTRDNNGRYVLYVKPADEKSFAVYPEPSDVGLYYQSFHTKSFDSVREQLGKKYYAYVYRHPEHKISTLMPGTRDVDLSRISKVNITKDRFKADTTILFATIDGEQQKPVELTKLQAQHFWLADDREAYKIALAAQLFQAKLCQGETQRPQQEAVSESEQVVGQKEDEYHCLLHR